MFPSPFSSGRLPAVLRFENPPTEDRRDCCTGMRSIAFKLMRIYVLTNLSLIALSNFLDFSEFLENSWKGNKTTGATPRDQQATPRLILTPS
jgi:hypothetical protein